jgi:hypothetical protein
VTATCAAPKSSASSSVVWMRMDPCLVRDRGWSAASWSVRRCESRGCSQGQPADERSVPAARLACVVNVVVRVEATAPVA